MLFEEWKYFIVEHIGRSNCMFAGIQFCKSYVAISIDNCLLINATHTFDCSNVVSILRYQVAGVLDFDLAKGFLLFFFSLQGDDLGFCKDQAVLATRPSRAFNRFSNISRLWRCHTHRTPAAEIKIPFFLSSLQARDWP